MVLHSRPITKSAAAAMAPVAASPGVARPAAAAPRTKPQVLQSGNAPAQLCFFFRRG
jgi:hypothetical protein